MDYARLLAQSSHCLHCGGITSVSHHSCFFHVGSGAQTQVSMPPMAGSSPVEPSHQLCTFLPCSSVSLLPFLFQPPLSSYSSFLSQDEQGPLSHPVPPKARLPPSVSNPSFDFSSNREVPAQWCCFVHFQSSVWTSRGLLMCKRKVYFTF